MGNTLIASTNLWRDGEIIAASSEASQFSWEYTQDDSPQLFGRSAAVASEVTVDCDFGEAKEYDFIGFIDHNLTDGATIVIYGADDDAFTSNVVSDTLTFNGNNLWEKLAAARTKRYVRISLTDTSNPSGYLQIGTIVVSKSATLNRNPTVPDGDGYQNATETEEAPSGARFTVQERPSLRVKRLQFEGLDDSSAAIVRAVLEACGSHAAWALCLDDETPNLDTYWGYLVSQEVPERQHTGFWNWLCEFVGAA